MVTASISSFQPKKEKHPLRVEATGTKTEASVDALLSNSGLSSALASNVIVDTEVDVRVANKRPGKSTKADV